MRSLYNVLEEFGNCGQIWKIAKSEINKNCSHMKQKPCSTSKQKYYILIFHLNSQMLCEITFLHQCLFRAAAWVGVRPLGSQYPTEPYLIPSVIQTDLLSISFLTGDSVFMFSHRSRLQYHCSQQCHFPILYILLPSFPIA